MTIRPSDQQTQQSTSSTQRQQSQRPSASDQISLASLQGVSVSIQRLDRLSDDWVSVKQLKTIIIIIEVNVIVDINE